MFYNSQQAHYESRNLALGSTPEERQEHDEDQELIRGAHRAWLEEEYNTKESFSQSILDAIYNKAWEKGHSDGFVRVEKEYLDALDIVYVARADMRM